MNSPRSAGSASIRARSPSSAPPERLEVGSTASTATVRPSSRQARASALSSVDLPAPGGPVTPTTCAGASPPSRAGETSASSAAICSRAAGARFSTRFSAAGAAVRSRSRSRAPSSAPFTAPRARIRLRDAGGRAARPTRRGRGAEVEAADRRPAVSARRRRAAPPRRGAASTQPRGPRRGQDAPAGDRRRAGSRRRRTRRRRSRAAPARGRRRTSARGRAHAAPACRRPARRRLRAAAPAGTRRTRSPRREVVEHGAAGPRSALEVGEVAAGDPQRASRAADGIASRARAAADHDPRARGAARLRDPLADGVSATATTAVARGHRHGRRARPRAAGPPRRGSRGPNGATPRGPAERALGAARRNTASKSTVRRAGLDDGGDACVAERRERRDGRGRCRARVAARPASRSDRRRAGPGPPESTRGRPDGRVRPQRRVRRPAPARR